MLPVSMVMEKPVHPPPLIGGVKKKPCPPRPRPQGDTSTSAKASTPMKRHPSPPHSLPASHFRRANPSIKLLTSTSTVLRCFCEDCVVLVVLNYCSL